MKDEVKESENTKQRHDTGLEGANLDVGDDGKVNNDNNIDRLCYRRTPAGDAQSIKSSSARARACACVQRDIITRAPCFSPDDVRGTKAICYLSPINYTVFFDKTRTTTVSVSR